ncbi:SMP-30/gluconolactonase/LRE family protein [Rhizobium sp. LC145]|uniref:SMP-30/gluconolactonase/LRE family protein n=1 Tax=Rhizobium sp. LC145 TaxID=1120688 RepID=UPI00062A20B0|nr:SMP-30/gluconolactonase/LRE family protein [Rhizobium sp. LC145]KKX28381.1 gluconolaconase [Rhizobium sp. LC145]TKT43678.1 SMP-30/gluconolactonase/LRE family protein [Rhizobiaceae bacterium LC148]
MTPVHTFDGKILSSTLCNLGEGPSFDPDTDTLWWFDILGKTLHELDIASGEKRAHALPFMGSVLARIDSSRQLIASDEGLFIRDRATGALSPYVQLEIDKPGNRSNDGRTHPSGSLWIGTMSKRSETGAGAIYHVAGGVVTKLVENISIPNSICFSPDGSIGYYVDTRVNRLMSVPLNPATGLPVGEATLLVDTSGEPGGMDGSVCDLDGHIWNARWGAGAVDEYDTSGRRLARHLLPAKNTSCPVFVLEGAGRLAVTSAWEGLDEAGRAADPLAGALFELDIPIRGAADPTYRL